MQSPGPAPRLPGQYFLREWTHESAQRVESHPTLSGDRVSALCSHSPLLTHGCSQGTAPYRALEALCSEQRWLCGNVPRPWPFT